MCVYLIVFYPRTPVFSILAAHAARAVGPRVVAVAAEDAAAAQESVRGVAPRVLNARGVRELKHNQMHVFLRTTIRVFVLFCFVFAFLMLNTRGVSSFND